MINQPAPILNFEWEACSLQGSIRRAPFSLLPPVRLLVVFCSRVAWFYSIFLLLLLLLHAFVVWYIFILILLLRACFIVDIVFRFACHPHQNKVLIYSDKLHV